MGRLELKHVDSFLRSLGFYLFALTTYNHDRKSLPEISSFQVPGPTKYGQIIYGQALYLRDAVNEIKFSKNVLATSATAMVWSSYIGL